MTQLIIECPFPHPDLLPNSRTHWSVKAKHTKKLRMDAYMATKASLKGAVFVLGDIEYIDVYLAFEGTPTRHRRADRDGLVSAFKGGFDGIADALGVNDKIFRPIPQHGNVHKQGRVIVTIG